jgi:hypothetical protein
MYERSKQAADRIREEIPILEVLSEYGYDVDPRAEDHEQQFRCDLHGDGNDGKPSARVYPGGGQFFCFACGRSRDAIALVQEKEGKSFWESTRLLEQKWNLPPLPWVEETRPPTASEEVRKTLDRSLTPERALRRVEALLTGVTQDRSLPAPKCAALWEAYDRLSYANSEGNSKGVVGAAMRVLDKTKQAIGFKGG